MFTAVYEEPGGEAEKDSILSSVTNLAEECGATKILGQELTAAKFREALESAPWIHYVAIFTCFLSLLRSSLSCLH